MKRAFLALATASLVAVGASSHAAPVDPAHGSAAIPTTLPAAEKELADLDRKLGDVDARTGKVTADVALKERRASARARAYARLARAGLLPVAGGIEALAVHAMKIEAARRAIVTDLDAVRSLQTERVALVTMRDQLAARRAVIAVQRDALAQAQAIVDEAEDRKRAFERAFSSSVSRDDHVAIYGAGITVHEPDEPRTSGFSAQKGRLPLPLSGRSEIRPARRESASGPGVELRASAGSSVRCVYPGRVAFSATYGDYGRLVIVDHGDHWFSVYANLGSVDVKIGDELSQGARLGTAGEGHGSGGIVYFELRHGAETVDPRPWLGL